MAAKKKRANPRIRSKKRANPRIRPQPGPSKTVVRWDKAPPLTRAKLAKCRTHKWRATSPHQACPICSATKARNQEVIEREKLVARIQHELAEARWQRQHAYAIRHSPVYLQGKLFEGGLKHGSDHDVRRCMCDMWVSSLHQLHELILGLPPEPDATELEYPIPRIRAPT